MASKSIFVKKANERSVKRLECPICKERFWLKCKFDDHMATHRHFKLSCNICSKSFYDQKLLDEHYLTHTEIIKIYDCKECPRKFLQKYQLEQHMQFHQPVGLSKLAGTNKESVHFNKVMYVKSIIDDTSSSDEDEEESEFSDFEDYIPANKISKTRSGRIVKRKKLFDEETEVKRKCPDTKQAHVKKSQNSKSYSQKNKQPKNSDMEALNKNVINKKLSVVIEKLSDRVCDEHVKKINVCTENQKNVEQLPKEIVSSLAKEPDIVTSNSVTDKNSKIIVSNELPTKNIIVTNTVTSPCSRPVQNQVSSLAKKPDILTTNSSTNENSKITLPNELPNKNIIVTNTITPPCPRAVQNYKSCLGGGCSKIPVGHVKPFISADSNISSRVISPRVISPPVKPQIGKRYVYVGHDPDINKIRKAIKEVSTMSDHRASVSNNISKKMLEATAQNESVSNLSNSSLSKNSTLPSNNVSLTSFNTTPFKCFNLGSQELIYHGSMNSLKSSNLLNENRVKVSLPSGNVVLGRKVHDYIVIKVTPECMEKMHRNPLVPSIQSSNIKTTEKASASHIASSTDKSLTASPEKQKTITESQKSNAVFDTSLEANKINNVKNANQNSPVKAQIIDFSNPLEHSQVPSIQSSESPCKRITEVTSASTSHGISNLNKNLMVLAGNQEITKEKEVSNATVDTLLEVNEINNVKTADQNNLVEAPVVQSSNSLEHLKISPIKSKKIPNKATTEIASTVASDVASNLNKSFILPNAEQEIISEKQKLTDVANTSFKVNKNNVTAYQNRSVETEVALNKNDGKTSQAEIITQKMLNCINESVKKHRMNVSDHNFKLFEGKYKVDQIKKDLATDNVNEHKGEGSDHIFKLFERKYKVSLIEKDLAPNKTDQISLQTNENLFLPTNEEMIRGTQKTTADVNTSFEKNENENIKVNQSNSVKETSVIHNKNDENKQISMQSNFDEPQAEESIAAKEFDYPKSKHEKNEQDKNYKKNNKSHKSKCKGNLTEKAFGKKNNEKNKISLQNSEDLTVTTDENEITKGSHRAIAIEVDEMNNLKVCQHKSVEDAPLTQNENMISPQSHSNAVNISTKALDHCKTKSAEKNPEKRSSNTLKSRKDDLIKKASTTHNKSKKKPILRKNRCDLLCKAVSKKVIKEDKTNHFEKNKPNFAVKTYGNCHSPLSKVSHNESNQISVKKQTKSMHEKLLQRYIDKLEEKERKKRERFEFKKIMKCVEKLSNSKSKDIDQKSFREGVLPGSGISIQDINKIIEKCSTVTKGKTGELTCELKSHFQSLLPSKESNSPLTKSTFTMQCPCNSKGISNTSREKNESQKSKISDESIEKVHSICLKFNKNLNENEYLKLLEEIDELIVTYKIEDKCQFLNPIIRFCRLYVDSYKVKQKAISLGAKLQNVTSS